MRIQIDGITLDLEKQTSPNHALLSELIHTLLLWWRSSQHGVVGREPIGRDVPKEERDAANGAAAPPIC